MQGWGKRENLEKTRRPACTRSAIPRRRRELHETLSASKIYLQRRCRGCRLGDTSRARDLEEWELALSNFRLQLHLTPLKVGGETCTALNIGDLRADEGEARRRRNARAGETGDPRENPPASGIVRCHSRVRKSVGRVHRESNPVRPVGGRVVQPLQHRGPSRLPVGRINVKQHSRSDICGLPSCVMNSTVSDVTCRGKRDSGSTARRFSGLIIALTLREDVLGAFPFPLTSRAPHPARAMDWSYYYPRASLLPPSPADNSKLWQARPLRYSTIGNERVHFHLRQQPALADICVADGCFSDSSLERSTIDGERGRLALVRAHPKTVTPGYAVSGNLIKRPESGALHRGSCIRSGLQPVSTRGVGRGSPQRAPPWADAIVIPPPLSEELGVADYCTNFSGNTADVVRGGGGASATPDTEMRVRTATSTKRVDSRCISKEQPTSRRLPWHAPPPPSHATRHLVDIHPSCTSQVARTIDRVSARLSGPECAEQDAIRGDYRRRRGVPPLNPGPFSTAGRNNACGIFELENKSRVFFFFLPEVGGGKFFAPILVALGSHPSGPNPSPNIAWP
ncbi:hypothetical protein PR048_006736 [Dryococelus australis]|uniref:Uncharacterized protein n=1 Tax=Dryococelus australis TaxID=614101 RepID=A0ABQ9ICS3_9NEOP|nr:hypothetical protein PR048_006736 [Dryococelus australis]